MTEDTKVKAEQFKNVTTEQAIIGAVIARFRDARGMLQKELAKKMEINESTWSRIEKGDTSLSVVEFNRLTKILGIPSSEILDAVDDVKNNFLEKGIDVKSTGAAKDWKGLTSGGMSDLGKAMLPVFGTVLFGLVGGAIGTVLATYKAEKDEQEKE